VLVLGTRALRRGDATVRELVGAAGVFFCLFVLALGVVVKAVVDNGLGAGLDHLLPGGDSLPELLAVAGIAAVLANLINNLPATLALLPLAAAGGTGPVLAVLVGVNLGPNLTYVGSLATLLWRGLLPEPVELKVFTRLGLIVVPLTVVAGTVCVWGMLRLVGT
jgi:arsenical pump membrane protein